MPADNLTRTKALVLLQVGKLSVSPGVIGQFVMGKQRSRDNVRSHENPFVMLN